jgi:PAS domain S-box-containing protein
MNNPAPSEAVRSALHDATRSLLTVLDEPHLSVAETARLRATAMLQNALVLTDPYLPDNPIVYANPAFLELSGYPREQIVGFNCRFLQGPKTDRAEVARLKEAIRTERPVQVTLLNYRRDGTTFWNELTVAPVRDEQGSLTHFVAVQTDVTALKESGAALKESEAALQESEQRLRLALESGRLGTWDLNLSTNKYLHLSALWRGHFGLAPDVMVTPAEVFHAVHPGDRDRLRRALKRAVATRQDYQAEYRVVWPDGSVHWISCHATPTYTAAGEPLRLVGMTQEITARKEQEAAMVRAL